MAHHFHSLRRTLHDKVGPFDDDPLPVFGVLVLAATAWAQTCPPIAEQIAKTYGLESFEKIEAIRYTFNAELPGVNISRSWVLAAQDRPNLLRGKG
jgi:hypothetical protein